MGSIYHRYSSRDEILAALWLELAEKFQARFLSALDGPDPVRSGLAAVRYVCGWVREHPHESRLLLLHRREDFASDRWPAGYHRRARTLANRAESSLRAYARRLCDRAGGPELRAVRFALVDLPTAALRRDLEAGVSPSRDVQRRLLETCAFTLRRIARRRTMPGRRT